MSTSNDSGKNWAPYLMVPPSSRVSPPSKRRESPKPPDPPIALPIGTQAAIRREFKSAGASKDDAARFLRLYAESADTIARLAGKFETGLLDFKALRKDATSKRHLRAASRCLSEALAHVAAIEHLPAALADDVRAEDEAIKRIQTRLDVISRLLASSPWLMSVPRRDAAGRRVATVQSSSDREFVEEGPRLGSRHS